MAANLTQDIEAAVNGDKSALRRVLFDHGATLSRLSSQTGLDAHPIGVPRTDQTVPVPIVGSINVQGVQGNFKITITDALQGYDNRAGALRTEPIFQSNASQVAVRSRKLPLIIQNDGRRNARTIHHIQSASDVNFSVNKTDFGFTQTSALYVSDPNDTKYWRFRSRFENSNFNTWTVFTDPTGNALGVYSGSLTGTGVAPVTAAYTPNSQPLTSTTGIPVNNATITVAASTATFGDTTISYSSGSISGLLDATLYYVYADDPLYKGGAVAYIADINNPVVTAFNGRLYFGSITTPVHGGGGTGGKGGGGGACFSGNTKIMVLDRGCVAIRSVYEGDQIITLDGPRRVKKLITHDFIGELVHMREGELVTPQHKLWDVDHWMRASKLFPLLVPFAGHVYNLEIDAETDREHCYLLANGKFAHNVNKQ